MPGLRSGSWVALLAMVASGASYASVIGTSEAVFRQLYSLGPNGHVSIQNQYGDIRITGWDRDDILVEAVKRSPDSKRLEEAHIIVSPAEGMLSIQTQYAEDSEHAKVEYRITMPRHANIDEVKLGRGDLSITGVAGAVRASSVNGSIKAEKLEGRADLSTVNGQLEADFESVGASHPITLSSVNGPIKLVLPHGTRASLKASNVSGGIDSDFGHAARVNGAQQLSVVHAGGAQIQLTNVNGGISIHAPVTGRNDHPTI